MLVDARDDIDAVRALLAEREAELGRIQRIGRIGGLEVDLRGGGFKNKRSPGYLLVHGLPESAANETHHDWLARIHPDDRARMERHFMGAVANGTTDYTAEYRVVRPSDGQVRWIFAKGEIERDADGQPLRFVGAHLDVTDRRRIEEQSELIARESAHRIKNLFSIIQGVGNMLARLHPEARAFAADFTGRLQALSQANDLIHSRHVGSHGPGGSLRTLIELLLAPYRRSADHIVVEGVDLLVSDQAATSIALIVHELATNAAKYGALSRDGGRLRVEVSANADVLRLDWRESGGPPVDGPPTRNGFGTGLSDRVARAALQAEITRDWAPDGLALTMTVPIERIAA